MKHFFISFVLALTALSLVPANALAHTLPQPASILPSLSSTAWIKTGAATIASNGLTATISETSTTNGSLYTDISIKNTDREFALLIAYTKAEDVRSDGDITGLPYIYGYFLDKNGKVISYLQGQSMRHGGTADDVWSVSYGVFRIPSGATSIRYFMKQAGKKGTAKDGRDATFAKPAVYLLEHKGGSAAIVSGFTSKLPDIWE